MIVSFAWTTEALLAGEKTVTTRTWSDRYLQQWRDAFDAGRRRHQAYDRSPRARGRQVGWITLTHPPRRKRLRDFTQAEIEGEGLRRFDIVRRITPTEAERLMGFPDGWTRVPYRGKPAADGPRYRALGNSMAVNVMSWIGQRIAMFEEIAE